MKGPKFCRGHETEAKAQKRSVTDQLCPINISQHVAASTRTKQSDGVAQLPAPLSSGISVELGQTLDDVPITNLSVADVPLQTVAPEGQTHM